MKLYISIIFLFWTSLVHANPVALYEPANWKSIAPLIQEDLTIEVFEKYSRFQGKFRFAETKDHQSLSNLKVPIVFNSDKSIYGNFFNYQKISVRCGEQELHWHGGHHDDSLTRFIQKKVGSSDINIQDADYSLERCSNSDIISIQYEQKNFSIGKDRMIVYLPILPGIKKRSDQFNITLINKTNSNLEIKLPKEVAKKSPTDPVTIHPLNKEVILAVLENVPVTSLPDIPEDEPKYVDYAMKRAIFIDSVIDFSPRQAQFSPSARSILDGVVEIIKQNPQMMVRVEGHTDDREAIGYDKKLSIQRAESVERYLLSKGIPVVNLTTVGYGSTRPVADNRTTEGRSKNRRVEFNVLKQ